MHHLNYWQLALAALAPLPALAQSSSCTLSVSTKIPAPSVAPGFTARVVASGLTSPRGIAFDNAGNLLVVQKNKGLVALTFNDNGGACLAERSRTAVSNDSSLNHGIALSPDQSRIYLSSAEAVYDSPYDPASARITGANRTVVTNMTTDDHTTRTLLSPRNAAGRNALVVTRGSTSNLDYETLDVGSGHSQIKMFNLSSLSDGRPFDFNTDGKLLGWGLRNDVGIDEIPNSGALYSVENSADNVNRTGKDIHQNNPAEKLNFLGWITPPPGVQQSTNQGANFGYPTCFTAWDPSEIPDYTGDTGSQFAIGNLSDTNNDQRCQSQFVPPRLSFQAHMAPLDIKFNPNASAAWISFHGSWDRDQPSGYKVGSVLFNGDQPRENRTSRTALVDIVSNQNNNRDCPKNCFRPVGLAFDKQGRLYFSSDSTGEIYVVDVDRSQPGSAASVAAAQPGMASSGTAPAAPSSSSNAATTSVEVRMVTYGVSFLSSLLQFL